MCKKTCISNGAIRAYAMLDSFVCNRHIFICMHQYNTNANGKDFILENNKDKLISSLMNDQMNAVKSCV